MAGIRNEFFSSENIHLEERVIKMKITRKRVEKLGHKVKLEKN